MKTVNRRKGAIVKHDGVDMKVVGLPDFDNIVLQAGSGEYFRVSVADLEAEQNREPDKRPAIDPRRQEKVQAYNAALGPLLAKDKLTAEEVRAAGALLGLSMSSAYRALARYKLSGVAADLPPNTKPGGRGKSRIGDNAETLIQDCIKEVVLTRRNFSLRHFLRVAKARLEEAGLTVAENTLRQRFASIPDHKLQKARKGAAETKRTHEPLRGEYPEVTRPLASLQIDHWYADILILGDDRLESVGRAWITIAIDIYSRMIWGMHIGLDPPSTATVGLAMISGMTRKDAVLAGYGLKMDMPIAGKPMEIRADNANEFVGNSIQASCDHFNIRLTWRPIDNPQYGAHIERLNNTLATRFKDLPGATGSNNKERKALRPEKTAAFTLDDLIKHVWLLIDEYHNEIHMGIKARPIDRYKSFFFGPEGLKRNLPDIYLDTMELRREWYPLEKRSIQAYGVRIDFLHYYNEDIAQLVRNRKGQPKVNVRRNPLDVREIFLEHPVRKEWIALPVRQIDFPIAAIWELQAACREALKQKRARTPEVLAQIIRAQQDHIEGSQKKTRTAQRAATRRSHNEKIRRHAETEDSKAAIASQAAEAGPAAPTNDPSLQLITAATAAHPAKERHQKRTRPPEPSASQKDSDFGAILAAITDEDVDRFFDD